MINVTLICKIYVVKFVISLTSLKKKLYNKKKKKKEKKEKGNNDLMENSGVTTFVHNFVHNSPTWRVVVGGGVTHHHPSTNYNSPHGRVVHIVVAPEPL